MAGSLAITGGNQTIATLQVDNSLAVTGTLSVPGSLAAEQRLTLATPDRLTMAVAGPC